MSVTRKSAFTFLTGSIVALGLGACATTGEPPSMGNAFSLTSSTFKDGTMLAVKNAGNIKTNPNCIGDNVSPPLSWSNVPEGTKSFALIMYDPEGRGGLGVDHWTAYGIPASTTGFAEGETSQLSNKYVPGKGTAGLGHYLGPCTPPGTGLHHYTFTLIATDLEPNALPAGLTRAELFAKLAGHSKGTAGLVGLFGRAKQ
jgi:Raf kinase inhibitor-like YbhB/YbcL family protein